MKNQNTQTDDHNVSEPCMQSADHFSTIRVHDWMAYAMIGGDFATQDLFSRRLQTTIFVTNIALMRPLFRGVLCQKIELS